MSLIACQNYIMMANIAQPQYYTIDQPSLSRLILALQLCITSLQLGNIHSLFLKQTYRNLVSELQMNKQEQNAFYLKQNSGNLFDGTSCLGQLGQSTAGSYSELSREIIGLAMMKVKGDFNLEANKQISGTMDNHPNILPAIMPLVGHSTQKAHSKAKGDIAKNSQRSKANHCENQQLNKITRYVKIMEAEDNQGGRKQLRGANITDSTYDAHCNLSNANQVAANNLQQSLTIKQDNNQEMKTPRRKKSNGRTKRQENNTSAIQNTQTRNQVTFHGNQNDNKQVKFNDKNANDGKRELLLQNHSFDHPKQSKPSLNVTQTNLLKSRVQHLQSQIRRQSLQFVQLQTNSRLSEEYYRSTIDSGRQNKRKMAEILASVMLTNANLLRVERGNILPHFGTTSNGWKTIVEGKYMTDVRARIKMVEAAIFKKKQAIALWEKESSDPLKRLGQRHSDKSLQEGVKYQYGAARPMNHLRKYSQLPAHLKALFDNTSSQQDKSLEVKKQAPKHPTGSILNPSGQIGSEKMNLLPILPITMSFRKSLDPLTGQSLLNSSSNISSPEQLELERSSLKLLEQQLSDLKEVLRQREQDLLFYKQQKMLYERQLSTEFCRQSWPIVYDCLQTLQLLGKGGFGQVYYCFDIQREREVALKINYIDQRKDPEDLEEFKRHVYREAQIQRSLDHPNIAKFIQLVQCNQYRVCFTMEFCGKVTLGRYLKRHTCLKEAVAKGVLRQIFAAIDYLSKRKDKVIHYDLKPSNIMYSGGIVKLVDFGLCKVFDSQETRMDLTSQGVGTYYYLPPETFQTYNPQITSKVDVWSAGVIFYELLYGRKPFCHGISQKQIAAENLMLIAYQVDFPKDTPRGYKVSDAAKRFIKRCLCYSPDDRLSPQEAYQHQYWGRQD